jgi:hypothetical protein
MRTKHAAFLALAVTVAFAKDPAALRDSTPKPT